LVFIDILQTALPADPFKLPSELFHFERFQSLNFLAFLKEFFFFTGLSARSSLLTRCVLATDGGGEVTWVMDDLCRVSVWG
jgi:hypothetical protein